MCIQGSVETTVDEYWYPVWGEYAKVRNNYNELFVTFTQEGSGRILGVRFRLFNDGLGFRYEFPEQPTLHIFQVEEELTEFNLGSDYLCFCRGTMIPTNSPTPLPESAV